jgi:hypothetical protein
MGVRVFKLLCQAILGEVTVQKACDGCQLS